MSLSLDTHTAQSRLAKYCRDGNTVEIPGLTPNRLFQYRRLVFNIIQDSFESGYPISFKYLPTDVWDEMVNDFFAKHECQNYQIWKLPKEFLEFVIENKYATK